MISCSARFQMWRPGRPGSESRTEVLRRRRVGQGHSGRRCWARPRSPGTKFMAPSHCYCHAGRATRKLLGRASNQLELEGIIIFHFSFILFSFFLIVMLFPFFSFFFNIALFSLILIIFSWFSDSFKLFFIILFHWQKKYHCFHSSY